MEPPIPSQGGISLAVRSQGGDLTAPSRCYDPLMAIIDQIRDLTSKRQVLIDQLIDALKVDVEELNRIGFSYALVQVTDAAPARKKRIDTGAIRWAMSITRVTNASRAGRLSKAQTLEAVRTALDKLAKKKGVEVPVEVLATAEQTVADAYSKK